MEPVEFCTANFILREGLGMRFYTFKLPKFLGGFVKAILNKIGKN